MGVPVRGVGAIKTLSAVKGAGTHSDERHVHQFQLASLELERARQTKSKQAALRRIALIDARLAEIERDIQTHQQALGLSAEGTVAAAPVEAPKEQRVTRVLRY